MTPKRSARRSPSIGVLFLYACLATGIGCGGNKTSTFLIDGLTVRIYCPMDGQGIGGTRSDPAGRPVYYENVGDSRAKKMVEFQVEGMRLTFDGRDYGPVRAGDVIEYYYGKVYRNGKELKLIPAASSKPAGAGS